MTRMVSPTAQVPGGFIRKRTLMTKTPENRKLDERTFRVLSSFVRLHDFIFLLQRTSHKIIELISIHN